MAEFSAGLLMFRRRAKDLGNGLEVFLVHPGGPFWKNKDFGAWSIPKGIAATNEQPLQAAQREFAEETGITPFGEFFDLGETKQRAGKTVRAWAFENDCSPKLMSNKFSMEWPPRSGRVQEFPEVDRGEWFSLEDARTRMNQRQCVFLDRLLAALPNPSTNTHPP